MLTLFASISGGLDWESAIQALMEVSGWAVALASRRLQNGHEQLFGWPKKRSGCLSPRCNSMQESCFFFWGWGLERDAVEVSIVVLRNFAG